MSHFKLRTRRCKRTTPSISDGDVIATTYGDITVLGYGGNTDVKIQMPDGITKFVTVAWINKHKV